VKPLHIGQQKINFRRWIQLKYAHLMRTPGGPDIVARGFAIGIIVEFVTLPTAGLAFLLVFPLVWLTRSSLAAALIGYVIGKVLYLPLSPISYYLGSVALPGEWRWWLVDRIESDLSFLPRFFQLALESNLFLLFGGLLVGLVLGAISFLLLRYFLRIQLRRRKVKRQLKKTKADLANEL
jgi:uncharacterized protein (DUF2062 family)